MRPRSRSASVAAIAAVALAFAVPAAAHGSETQGPKRLPLGDGKISAAPLRDHVMACSNRFPGGGGAHRTGSWVRDGHWHPSEKPRVEGRVAWPGHSIEIRVEGDQRIVRSNNLPGHATGVYPIQRGTAAYDYDRNPNSIRRQPILLRLPAEPKAAAAPSCVPMGMIGFALSGVAIFNAFDLSGRDAPAYEIQDSCNGHPELTGQYHYHDWSSCLGGGDPDAPVGWMLDGFPILGPHQRDGSVVVNADLDECHGRVGPVLIDGVRREMYHYRFTYQYPYTIGCFRGTPLRLR